MAAKIIWLLLILVSHTTCQKMKLKNQLRICNGGIYKSVRAIKKLEGCVVVLGNLQISIDNDADFHNITFDVREVTEYLVIYRVKNLESVGQLFPYLTRIRGVRLLNNFALIVFENFKLREINLYSLLKIDRGGVIMWSLPQACYVNTVDWKMLAPNARRVIAPVDKNIQCIIPCTCTLDKLTNYCWNNKKCQLYLEGPEAFECHEQCLGCSKTKPDLCSLCRHYTHNGNCVTKCPPNTIIIPDNQICITKEECRNLHRLVWNNTCIADCPIGYVENNEEYNTTCEICTDCGKTCENLIIQSIGDIEAAEKCVYINGSLTIHIRKVYGAIAAMRKYMSQIEEVSDYIAIEGSDVLTSLDILSNLRRIKGENLKDNKYSLYINKNRNLKTLFTLNVTKHLQIDRGILKFDSNPKLCVNKIDEARNQIPNKAHQIEIIEGTNGYRCEEVKFNIELQPNNDTSVKVKFSPVNHKAYYSVLHARLPPNTAMAVLPESCSELEWQATDVPIIPKQNFTVVNLTSLRLASTYIICIEFYDPDKKALVRSNLINFTTPLGVPEPPFIIELVASASDAVVIRWVDHKNYLPFITRYELDVTLIELHPKYRTAVNYCNYKEDPYDIDTTRHALVRRPPEGYGRGCESMCGILSSLTPGALVEDSFDVCDDFNIQCDNNESIISRNTSFGRFVRTLVLNISSPKDAFRITRLAPFSDYKFGLRACINKTCSRSARGVVRTFHLMGADVPTVVKAYVNEMGYVYVKWEPPKVSNGPILAYYVDVMPMMNIKDLLPQSWCVLANETEIIVKSVITSEYSVKVCMQTLASTKSCGDRIQILLFQATNKTWKIAIVCGAFISIGSILLGWLLHRRGILSDVVPLVDSTSSTRVESEPPSEMFSDLVVFHSVIKSTD